MNPFDSAIEHFLNRFAGRWPSFDLAVVTVDSLNLFKGGVMVALLWWAWGSAKERDSNRERVISTMAGVALALVVARSLAHALPFRVRPLLDAGLGFRSPYGVQPDLLMGWSAFPSDHAALFFGLAMGLFLISRALGIAAFLYAAVVIALPRAYLGYHHPTDLIGGGLLGCMSVAIACSRPVRERISRPIVSLSARNPGPFHAAIFFVTFQMANLFEAIRVLFWRARH